VVRLRAVVLLLGGKMNSAYMHRLASGATRFFVTSVTACVLGLSGMTVNAQVTTDAQQTLAPTKDRGKYVTSLFSLLQELVEEVERSNAEIAARRHTWKAATDVPKRVSALPEAQFLAPSFTVSSPRQLAGFSDSEFACIDKGTSQELLHPRKRRLSGQDADFPDLAIRGPGRRALP
jgi:hypothetical protein